MTMPTFQQYRNLDVFIDMGTNNAQAESCTEHPIKSNVAKLSTEAKQR